MSGRGLAAGRARDGQQRPRGEPERRRAPSAAGAPRGGGSGRSRMAVEIVIRLTRHAETATTASVSSTPSA